MRALFIAHEAEAPPGHLGDAAARRGMDVEVCDVWDGATLPAPDVHDLIVPLGSADAAYDDAVPWLAAELDLLREAEQVGTPVFGVCFGAQALARALGGQVFRADEPEVGWRTIDTSAPGLIAAGPWLEWHFDALRPPDGASVLARSRSGVQAWLRGRALGVQFHPEVTPGIIDGWIASGADKLRATGVDADRLSDETRRNADRARVAAHDLFDRVLDALAVDPPR
ncbi:MAG TPA: type 1 glutamine amidotransferase [Euzebyales bacterium]